MIIGIKMTPGPGGGSPSVFYCGRNGVEFRKAHAELVAANKDGTLRFFTIAHPLLVPLQCVEHSTENHPDIVAAQERRARLAEVASKAAPVEIKIAAPEGAGKETAPIIPIPGSEPGAAGANLETITPEARRAELTVLKHADLRAIAEGIKNSGRPIALTTGTKAQLIEAILASEISTSGSDCPPSGVPPAAS